MATQTDFIVKNGLVVGQGITVSNITIGDGGVSSNLLFGEAAGGSITGTNNVVIGSGSGSALTTGSNNVIIGAFSGNDNGLDISATDGYVVISDGAGVARIVSNDSGQVGINTVSPTATLDVSGSLKANAIEVVNVTVTGDITVAGSVISDDFRTNDAILTLNADLSSQVVPFEDSGLQVNRGARTNAFFIWDETNNYWTTGDDPEVPNKLATLESYIDGGTY